MRFGIEQNYYKLYFLYLTSYATSDKLFNFSKSQLSHMCNKYNISHFVVLRMVTYIRGYAILGI